MCVHKFTYMFMVINLICNFKYFLFKNFDKFLDFNYDNEITLDICMYASKYIDFMLSLLFAPSSGKDIHTYVCMSSLLII